MCPFISTNIILLWYYIISFFLFPLNPRLNVSLHFAFILFCIYIYTSAEIYRNPTKKQFHRYLLGIPLAKNMFFIPEDTYYKPWRAIIFLPLLIQYCSFLESSRFIRGHVISTNTFERKKRELALNFNGLSNLTHVTV